MDNDAAALYKFNAEAHQFTYNWCKELEKRVNECADLQELADYGYVLYRIETLLDDSRKEAKRLSEKAQQLQCAIQTAMGNVGPVRTQHCTASPKVTFQTPIPKKEKDPDAYYAICKMLGIPPETADVEAVRPHWPGVRDYLTKLMSEGKPLPKGINPNAVKSMYSVTYRRKNDSEI